jgi:CheY-like chemotaxis protein
VVPDGIEALKALRGTDGYEPLPRPYMILLDLNLPRMNGLEFLQTLRQDDHLKRSIVFVLTTSDRHEDMVAAYDKQVAGYFLKSRAGEDFMNVVDMLDAYWRVVEFPPEVNHGR